MTSVSRPLQAPGASLLALAFRVNFPFVSASPLTKWKSIRFSPGDANIDNGSYSNATDDKAMAYSCFSATVYQ